MMRPDTYGGDGKEPGFALLRKEYGEAMVQRILNWPILTSHTMQAQSYPADDEILLKAVEQAKRNVERARIDKDYARLQAEAIARKIPKGEWDLVPSVSQLLREWDVPGPGSPPLTPTAEWDLMKTLEIKATEHYLKIGMTPEAAEERAARLIVGIAKTIE